MPSHVIQMPERPAPEGRCSTASPEDEWQSGKRERLRSPLAASRLEEKEELQDLNDRLSRYIEYMQQNLFGAGSSVDVEKITRSMKSQLDDLSGLYADELDAARKSLDSIALQLADCQVKLKTAQVERDELAKELDHIKSRDKRSANEIASLNAELSRLESEMERGRELQREYDDLLKQHAIVKDQLERETIMRTDWQNRVLTLSEQLEFKDRLLEKERATWSSEVIQVQMRTVANEAEKYRNKLKQKLDELRDEMSDQLSELQSKMENSMQAKLELEQGKTKDAEARAKTAREECSRISSLLASRSSELLTCRKEIETLRRTIDQLNAQLEDMEARYRKETERNQEEIARLLDLVDEKSRECAELASIKVQLDAEIAMYRSLLESEESRCRLPSAEKNLTGKTIFTHTKTEKAVKRPFSTLERDVDMDAKFAEAVSAADHVVASVATPLKSQVLRDKHSTSFDEVYTQHGAKKTLRITCYADGPVHFASADPGNGLLRISNASDHAVDLSHWQLHFGPTRPGAEDYTTLHVFDESQKLKPHAEMRVHVCPTRGDQINCIPSKRTRRHLSTLYLVTESPVWEPYTSLITLQDMSGVVRAVCEIEPLDKDRTHWLQTDGSEKHRIQSVRVTCTATGAVHFQSVESGKGILNLCNAGDETINLSDWHLRFECPSDVVSQTIPKYFELEPHGEIRVHLCHTSERKSKLGLEDPDNLFLFTEAATQDYHDSTFTLYDPDNVVRAISKIERISSEQHKKGNSEDEDVEETASSAETSDESETEEDEEDEEEQIDETREHQIASTSTGGSLNAAFYSRYRQFLDNNPRKKVNPCSCPLM